MKTIWILTSVVLMSAALMSRALAQDTVGGGAAQVVGLPNAISSGSYGPGFYSSGVTGPGSYGPGSYGSGSYGSGSGATTGPPTPFSYFNSGGAAAGTSVTPNAPLR
jgi:hypothetical protein